MSTLFVEVKEIVELLPHANADALEIVHLSNSGWQVVVQKGQYQVGQKVLHFLPDTVLSTVLSDKYNVTKYLGSGGRTKTIKLRGEVSFGFIIPAADDYAVGENVADQFGGEVSKYEPPVNVVEDAERDDPRFPRYTGIEHLRQFPEILRGQIVYITEKLHGTNVRVAFIDEEMYAGSHNNRRKKPENFSTSRYWLPWTLPEVDNFLRSNPSAVLYGEIYGGGIQKGFMYDSKTRPLFRAFDLLLDGKYVEFDTFQYIMQEYKIPTVPVLATGLFNLELIKQLAQGTTTIGDCIREGVVVGPVHEMFDPKIGRVKLKYISDEYMVKADTKREKGEPEIAH